jgi:hypothetical protein
MTDPRHPQFQKFAAECNAASAALDQGDMRTCLVHYLLGCIEAPDKDLAIRYEMFQSAIITLTLDAEASLWTGDLFTSLLQTHFVENEQELLLYRAEAANLLAHRSTRNTSSQHQNSCPEAIAYYQRALGFCAAANAQERCKVVQAITPSSTDSGVCIGQDTSVGEILDDLRKFIEDDMEYQKDRIGFLKRSLAKDPLFRQSEVADEFLQHILRPSASDLFRKPHNITSAIMEQVMKLPETNTTVLIISDIEDFVAPPVLATLKMVRVFRAMAVNLERFRSGKRTNVFDQVQALMCDPRVSSQKNVLSTFVLSCLEPFVLFPGTPQTTPSSRPRRVLLEKESDADDPQVQMFLAMMGCSRGNVEAADPGLVQLLRETHEEVLSQSSKYICSKEDKPHLWDSANNINCGNCEKVGPTLKRCACRKAYYCSTECQKLQWTAHKSDHKAAVRKKNAKNGQT